MARLTKKATTKTKNVHGTKAYVLPDKEKLMTMITTSFFNEKKFYGDNSSKLVALAESICKDDPGFIAKLGVYTRREMHMRTVTQVLMAILAKHGKEYARNAISAFCERPDDLTNMLAYYIEAYGRAVPQCMKKGCSDAIADFNEYSLAKYKGKGQSVSLKDLFCMVHPKAKKGSERYELYNRLLNGNLKVPDTWEVELSKSKDKKASWERLIKEKKLGYMAALRNLRNIIEADVDSEATDILASYLTKPEAIAKSKQLPFRFLAAYRELEKVNFSGKLAAAVNEAIGISVQNLPKFKGRTFVLTDNSGSMSQTVSDRSSISMMEIGNTLAAACYKMNPETVIGVFGERFKDLNPAAGMGLLEIARLLCRIDVGYATYAYLGIDWLIRNKIKVDRIILLSDMQVYGPKGGWCGDGNLTKRLNEYRKKINPDTWMHSIDLAGYGTSQFGSNYNLISGWSEKILKFIQMVEYGGSSMLKEIEGYKY